MEPLPTNLQDLQNRGGGGGVHQTGTLATQRGGQRLKDLGCTPLPHDQQFQGLPKLWDWHLPPPSTSQRLVHVQA